MHYVLLVIHVATAIIFIGGVTVSASVFPRYATAEAAAPYAENGGHPGALAMHRITRGYGRLAIITPVVGLMLAMLLGRLGELWILISVGLVVLGGWVLVMKIIPTQVEMLREPPTDPEARKRAMLYPGLLNVIWLAVLVLMIVKPGGVG
ncbi:hypothetical protein C5E07_16285 [Pseudoclavibacter sp. RFBJ3]|uniref:hypothetical protein n=1 Tax=unclassified Pseudoclavibacter TaxID=2615177 RepID=UPI000CE77D2E|nr:MULTISPECIES: hypothetical protein [unclassified Pseudoclavibacter]PPF87504.1 hypothetical protein C5C12_00095 [Pseudoclavibacter sp. RFBJ5]PPF90354.1 hypothetical protein C5E07_16285 [Pseudoclavibacter sp. RFBJ3]PPG01039.1 hypothetical protein C5C19_00095 [Pseudoclavibacter sp. RFBH5]PPG26142.1 hypothetical protein C5E13_00050 [Pseudoclavibacter sp. RFBI4]